MSIYPGLFKAIPETKQADRYLSPFRLLALLIAIIFLSEMVAMVVIYYLDIPRYFIEALVDSLIMVALILPGLYYLQLNPLIKHIQERNRTEDALRQSEELLRNILELLPVGVWLVDKQGEVVYGNPATQEIWAGARYVGLQQYSEYRGWWPETGEQIKSDEWAAARVITRGETVLNEEINIEAFDGAHKTILNSAVPIRDEQNSTLGAVIVNQDITKLKRAQQALVESEALFRTAMENMPVGVWLTDGSGKVIYGNPAGQNIWAGARYFEKEEFGEYKGWWLSTGKRIEPQEWAAARAIDRGETSLNEEIEIECFDGTHKIILNSAIPVSDEQGRILWAFVVNQDITDRKQRERALVQTNELLERYFSSISTLIAYMDRAFNFIRVNEAYALSAGHPVDYFTGKNHFDLYPHEENQAIFSRVVETGEAFSVLEKPFEYPEFPERGTTYWDWSVQPVKETDGTVQGLVLSLVDVTERKRAELKLERQNQDLLELSRSERHQRELAESLVRSSIILNSSLNLQEVLNAILEQIRRSIPYEGASIALLDGGIITVAGYLGFEGYPESVIAMGDTYSTKDIPLFRKLCSALQPVCITDTRHDLEWRAFPGLEWVLSYLAAPLVVDGNVIGILSLNSSRIDAFDTTSVERLTAFSNHAALALHNARLYQAEIAARQIAETLSAAAQALTQTLDVDQVIHTLLEHIRKIVPSDTSGVALLEDDIKVTARVVHGYELWKDPEQVLSVVLEIGSTPLLHKLLSSRKTELIDDITAHPEMVTQIGAEDFRAWLLVPIIASDTVIGVLGMGKREAGFYVRDHAMWIEALVGQAAVAIQNAWLFEQVRSSSDRLQHLAHKLVDIQEKERYNIARELHDEAGQTLSILKLGLGRLEQNPECPPVVRERLQDLKAMADGVLEEIHRIAMDLRPASLDHLGLVPALRQLASSLNSEELHVQFKEVGFEGVRISQSTETALYRIVQEALTNVLRHSSASNVGVLLERRPDCVQVFVEDDGIGFNPDLETQGISLGLVGMRERAEMLGGTLFVESVPGEGTTVKVEVPDGGPSSYR